MLASELQLQIGQRQSVKVFQDVDAIPYGSDWHKEIQNALSQSSFLIPIVTPGFFQSEWCCYEVTRFREREQELGRDDLIFPLIYVPVKDIRADEVHDASVLDLLNSRQRIDFSGLRFRSLDDEQVSMMLSALATSIRAALRKPTSEIDARRQAEAAARRKAEAEAEARREAEEEAARGQAEAAARLEAEAEVRREAEEAVARVQAEAAARLEAEAEARREAEEAAARDQAEAAARLKAETEARRKAEEAAARVQAEAAARLEAEAEARREAEAEAARVQAEDAARLKAEAEARRKAEAAAARVQAEDAARLKAEAEARRKAEAAAARGQAEAAARLKAEAEARRKAKQETHGRTDQEARRTTDNNAGMRAAANLTLTVEASTGAPTGDDTPRQKAARTSFNEGLAHYRNGRDDLAIEKFRNAVELDPDFVLAVKNLEIAIAGKAAKRTTRRTKMRQAVFRAARSCFELGNHDEAIRHCNELIRLDPSDAEALYQRGLAFHAMGEQARALADLDKSRQLGGGRDR